MQQIFISYRREETSGDAGRLYDRLCKCFGEQQIFFDRDKLKGGEEFPTKIISAITSSKALIVLIGQSWATVTDENGGRKLDNPQDWVRLEVETALEHKIEILPVLVQRASMPTEKFLPRSLSGLARRQACELSDSRFNYDVDQLIKLLREIISPKPNRVISKRVLVFTSIILIVLVAYLILPAIASYYRDRGYSRYKADRLASAESDYTMARVLNPNDSLLHAYLGRLNEDKQNPQVAHDEYQLAAKLCYQNDRACAIAYNNLARLYILEKEYSSALGLLSQLRKKSKDSGVLGYYYYKNLGWVRFKQNRLEEAKAALQEAIDLSTSAQSHQQATPHCLLAQALEKEGDTSHTIQKQWEKCIAYASPSQRPEEDSWIEIARKRLQMPQQIPKVKRGES
ncbi:MAG: hypothetical protein NPIRA05_13010 [Nitrospirales bacterium]|nr:MAG: hypothetical protein NPIRA05_13010 [Nitrospirales bacterium]